MKKKAKEQIQSAIFTKAEKSIWMNTNGALMMGLSKI